MTLRFAADFADIYEVRGLARTARGQDLPPEVAADRLVLGYRGLDGVVRRTRLRFTPAPSLLTASIARIDRELAPRQQAAFFLAVGCERQRDAARLLPFDEARAEAEVDQERSKAWSCHLRSSNGQVNDWGNRALSDLHMMTTELPTGPYLYAGVPPAAVGAP